MRFLFLFLLLLSNARAHESVTEAAHRYHAQVGAPGVAFGYFRLLEGVAYRSASGGVGWADREGKIRMTADHVHWLGSVTKTATGIGVALAIEEGKLSLDDDVNQLLKRHGAPFQVHHPLRRAITVRDLVTHRSGIRDTKAYLNSQYYTESGKALAEVIDPSKIRRPFHYLKTNGLLTLRGVLSQYLDRTGVLYSHDNFTREVPDYSNVGTALAGYLVELVMRMPLEEYLHARVFDPLKMHNTRANMSLQRPMPRLVVNYLGAKNIPLPLYNVGTWPDGGLRSSANDLIRYLAAIMQHGKGKSTQLMDTISARRLIRPLATLEEGVKIGIFWQTVKVDTPYIKRTLIGHDGGDPGMYSFLFFDPYRNVGCVILANSDEGDDDAIHLRFMETLLSAAEKL